MHAWALLLDVQLLQTADHSLLMHCVLCLPSIGRAVDLHGMGSARLPLVRPVTPCFAHPRHDCDPNSQWTSKSRRTDILLYLQSLMSSAGGKKDCCRPMVDLLNLFNLIA